MMISIMGPGGIRKVISGALAKKVNSCMREGLVWKGEFG
jgi:hypothetical protein